MARTTASKDRASLYQRFFRYLTDRRRARLALRRGPRTLAEALRDSGALQMPAADRFTGSALERTSSSI